MRVRHGSIWIAVALVAGLGAVPAAAGTSSDAEIRDAGEVAEEAERLPRAGSTFRFLPSALEITTHGASHSQQVLHKHGFGRPGRGSRPESYMLLKGGGLFVAEDDGLYLGVEVGGSVDRVLDFGISLDYFHRRTSERVTLADTQFEQLPVEVVATLDESSAHLVPLGVTLRVHLPFGGDTFAPFVSGTAAYETLFLNNVGDPNSDDPILRALDENETFSGFGWQAAAGLDLRLSPSLSAYGELGMHKGSPSKEIDYQGLPVDLNVDLDGAFLRGGIRFSL